MVEIARAWGSHHSLIAGPSAGIVFDAAAGGRLPGRLGQQAVACRGLPGLAGEGRGGLGQHLPGQVAAAAGRRRQHEQGTRALAAPSYDVAML